MRASYATFDIRIRKEGGIYVARCPELGIETRARTKSQAKKDMATLIMARQESPAGTGGFDPSQNEEPRWEIFRIQKGSAPGKGE